MADDLTGQPAPARRHRLGRVRFSPLSVATGIVATAALGLSCYLLIAERPLGGEPLARVTLDEASAEAEGGSGGGSTAAAPAMRATVDPDMQADGRDIVPVTGAIVIRDPATLSVSAEVAAPPDTVLPALIEESPHGPLPRIGPDGLRPADAYSRAAPQFGAEAPRIAVVMTGMGLSTTATERAIAELPAGVTFAFAPYGREVRRLAASARQDGHEIMLQVPLEPYDYPDNDPGPYTLLTGLSAEQNRDRLHWVMSRFGGYVGVTNYMGARFTASDTTLRPFLGELRDRGLVYADDGASSRSLTGEVARDIRLAFAGADLVIDAEPNREAIRARLAELRELALEQGLAVGMASGLPASIEEIARWSEDLADDGIAFVPITAAVAGGQS